MRIQRVISLIAITISVPLAAQHVQTLRDRDPDLEASKKIASDLQQANFHNGPWYLLSRFRIADAGFSQGSFVPTGESEGGISLKLEAPQRLYYVPSKKTLFSAELVPGYSFFQEGERQNQFDYLVRGDAHFLLNHLYLDVYGMKSDQIQAHVSDINRLATVRDGEFGVAGEVKYSSKTSGLFTLRVRDTVYPEDRFQPDPESGNFPMQVLDRREKNGRLSLLHKTFPRTSLFVAVERSDYDFDNVRAYASRRTYAGGGFQFDSGRTSVRLEAGPMRLEFDDTRVKDYDGFIARLGVTRDSGRWRYRLGANRDLGFSMFVNNPYFVATQGEIGADYSANRRLTLHARSAYERDEFESAVDGQFRTDDISFTSVGFTYAMRRISAGLDVGWYERDSTAFGDTASGIRYVVRLSLVP